MQARLSQYDLFTPATLQDAYPLYEQMRREAPVYFAEDLGYWVLTRYDDVAAALHDERLSSDRHALFAAQIGSLDVGAIANFLRLHGNMMIEKDPPDHTRLRKIAAHGFTPKAMESWRDLIESTTKELLDPIQNRQEMDIVGDLSVPLPALVIGAIFGVPAAERDRLIEWAADMGTFWGAPTGENIETLARRADASSASCREYIMSLIEERRREPGSDMISLLTQAYEANKLSLEELPSLCVLILNAGHLTTTDLIPNGVNALLQHPDQWQKLKANPQLLPSAIEEMIRFDTPAPFVFRIAKEDITIRDRHIPAGSVIALGIGPANRDPQVFTNPDTFDIERSPNEHLGFAPGIHFCLGVVLARMELKACFSALLEQMPNLRFNPKIPAQPKRPNLVFKGFDSLPVLF